MKFNKYIWDIYKSSEEGSSVIEEFLELDYEQVNSEIDDQPVVFELSEQNIEISPTEHAKNYFSKVKINDFTEAMQQYEKYVQEGLYLTNQLITNNGDKETALWHELIATYIINVSFGLYLAYPEYFIPYSFTSEFNKLQRICEEFNIPIPPIPNKKNMLDRAMYYAKLNQSFFEFRKSYDLSPAEMCAFLYDFAQNYLKVEEGELPPPSRVWLIQGGAGGNGDFEFVDEANEDSTSYWQGNIDTRRGDILLMYCVSPRSYIHSIWRASCDGFIDPFFYYYSTIWIQSPIKTVPVSFKEIKQDPLLSNNGYVRSSLQGPSGKPFSVEEYQAILKIMESKGQDISILPQITVTKFLTDVELAKERDVEIHLIEPLLSRLGYSEKDWVRQMPIKMGRGERNYPDYAFNAVTKRGEENATMVLESKFQISTKKELKDAYYQAKSYALRLQSKVMVLASKEGIWIYLYNKGNFYFDDYLQESWDSLTNPDIFHKVLLILGKK